MDTAKQVLEVIAQRFGVGTAFLNYLVHFDPERRIAYFETPKVACTSIKKYMQDQVVGRKVKLRRKGDVHDRALSPIRPLSELAEDEIRAVFFGPVRRFTFVRNPYTRALSGYLDKIVTNEWERQRHLPRLGFETTDRPGFLDFLQALERQPENAWDIHFALQSRLVLAGDVAYDFIGRFEAFDADFQEIKRRFYADASEDNYARFGKHHASGASEKVRQYYGEEEARIVRSLYDADFRIFGYSTDLERSSEPPDLSKENLRRSLETTLTRLGMSALDPAQPRAFIAAIEGALKAGRLEVLQASDLLLRASETVSAEAARILHLGAIEVLAASGFPGRARNERERFDQRFA